MDDEIALMVFIVQSVTKVARRWKEDLLIIL